MGSNSADVTVTTEEGEHILPDGVKLYMHKWIPDKPLAKLFFIHGFSDHIQRYNDFFPTLARKRILVTGVDLRGFGRSSQAHPSLRGRTGPASQALSDIAHMIETTQLPSPDLPLFIMGHSMGGALLLTLCSTPKYESLISNFSGIILEAPWLRVTPQASPPAIKEFAGRLASKILPNFQLANPIDPEKLTHDPVYAATIRADTLSHDTGSLEGFQGMLDRAAALRSGAVRLSPKIRSLFLQHGSEDYLIDYGTNVKYFDTYLGHVPDREFRTYDGWNHLLHADFPGSAGKYADDVAQWILARTPGSESFVKEEERESFKVREKGGLKSTVTEGMWKVSPPPVGKAGDGMGVEKAGPPLAGVGATKL